MHIPVLLKETIELLDPKPGEFFIDGTAGAGGHSGVIQEQIGPPAGGGKLLAIDLEKTGDNYADLAEILKNRNLGKADGLLLDLGFSSEQIGSPAGGRAADGEPRQGRGFSFKKDEPLLMTYDLKAEPLKQILKELTEEELAKIIKEFGEERFAIKIAKAIYIQERQKPIETTFELVEVIRKSVPKNYERGRIHPATRTFQALRIYANHELENLEKVLRDLPEILKPGARVAIISFHSLEDRLVKNYFRDYAKVGTLKILTKKPIRASITEIRENPRARSAKLRVAIML